MKITKTKPVTIVNIEMTEEESLQLKHILGALTNDNIRNCLAFSDAKSPSRGVVEGIRTMIQNLWDKL